jgi:pimeloyl-ACP methyl ester carboxylesterase
MNPANPNRSCVLSYHAFSGSRGCILLIHGMAGSHAYFARPLARIGGFRQVLPDLLGHGDSQKPDIGYTLEDHLDPLLDLVRREGFPRPLVLGGHSMGAALSVALASSLPKGAVDGLLLLNLPWFESALELHGVLRTGSEAYRKASEGIEVLRDEDVLKVGPDALRSAGNALPSALRDSGRGATETVLQGTAYHLLFRFRIKEYANVLSRVPSLALLGAEDPVAPPHLALPHLREFPPAKAILIEGAGHHLIHTHREMVRAEVEAFLDGIATVPRPIEGTR